MKTSEILAKLKGMAAKAGEAIFERTRLAATVLGDDQWIESEFCGDSSKAMQSIEADCFPELCHAFGLNRLLVLLKTFPTLAEWRANKFNLVMLWAIHEERQVKEQGDKPKRERRNAKIEEVEERDSKIKELEWTIKQAHESVLAKETEVERLRRENDELRGELKAMNRMLEQMRQERRQAV